MQFVLILTASPVAMQSAKLLGFFCAVMHKHGTTNHIQSISFCHINNAKGVASGTLWRLTKYEHGLGLRLREHNVPS